MFRDVLRLSQFRRQTAARPRQRCGTGDGRGHFWRRASIGLAARLRAAGGERWRIGRRNSPTDDAAERSRSADRAAGIAANRDLAHSIRNSNRRAGGGAPGNSAAVGRVAGRTVMRVKAEDGAGELGRQHERVMTGIDTRPARAESGPPSGSNLGNLSRRSWELPCAQIKNPFSTPVSLCHNQV